jgi:hypothetical protein
VSRRCHTTTTWRARSSRRLNWNGNGIPDAWERRYFGALDVPGGSAAEDWDADGLDNRAEYIAGTDPTNPVDYFALAPAVIDGLSVVSFPARAADTNYGHTRYYSLESAANLPDNTWLGVENYTNLPGADQDICHTNPIPALYRGLVWLQ